MKIQEISFPLGLGIADELLIVVSNGIAYYKLIDTSKMVVEKEGKKTGHKILYSDTLVLSEEQQNLETVNNIIINLLGVTVIE